MPLLRFDNNFEVAWYFHGELRYVTLCFVTAVDNEDTHVSRADTAAVTMTTSTCDPASRERAVNKNKSKTRDNNNCTLTSGMSLSVISLFELVFR